MYTKLNLISAFNFYRYKSMELLIVLQSYFYFKFSTIASLGGLRWNNLYSQKLNWCFFFKFKPFNMNFI